MNILTDRPLLYRSPLEEQKDNVAIGRSFAQDFIQGFNKGQDNKREDQRWADGQAMRDAQLAGQQAQNKSAQAKFEQDAIEAAKKAERDRKAADFAGLHGSIVAGGWSDSDQAKFYDWLAKNPEFYGSNDHKIIESGFANAKKARADKERFDADRRSREAIAKERGASGNDSSKLTIEQREMMRRALDGIDNDVNLTGNEAEKAKRRAEVYKQFGVSEPGSSSPASGSSQPTSGGGQPEKGSQASADGSGEITRFTRDPSGKIVKNGESQAKPEESKKAGMSWLDSILKTIGNSTMPSRPLP